MSGYSFKVLGTWTGARVAFPAQSAGAEPWSNPFDHAAPIRTPASRPFITPQEELPLVTPPDAEPSADADQQR